MKKSIAVLITCHNRKEKTLQCLTALHQCTVPAGYEFEVFLVDDGSTDGTGIAVKEQFPLVNIIQGNGNLYWNRGMRLAWETAAKSKEFDFYLWLNDDTLLVQNALIELIECYNVSFSVNKSHSIIVGSCKESTEVNKFSYGGRNDRGTILPNGKLQKCTFINGNVVLINKEIFKALGNLSNDYTHAMGDFDYGLRAKQKGIDCYISKSYIAVCPLNEGSPNWCNPKIPLLKRLKALHTPNGLNINEYIIFRKKFWKWKWIIFALKAYLKSIFPSLYSKFKLN